MNGYKISYLVRFALGVVLTSVFLVQPVVADDDHDEDQDTVYDFSELRVVLEQNATDGDSEVVLFAKGQDDGLNKLTVLSPYGEVVAKFKGDKEGVGIREFLFESAEPPGLDLVLASFPEGIYKFRGRTVEGDRLRGFAYLSHEVAPQTVIQAPANGATVSRDNVVVSWVAIPEAVVYIVEVKNEVTENALLVEVPVTADDSTVLSFDVPKAWLESGTEHQVAVGVKTSTGNLTNVESTFYTD